MSRLVRPSFHALAFVALAATSAAGVLAGCKKHGSEGAPPAATTGAPSAGASGSGSAAPSTALPRFERFFDAHLAPSGAGRDGLIQVAGVTRDNAIVLADYDASLSLKSRRDLAQGFVAGDSTRVSLEPTGLVVVNGKINGDLQTWLLQEGAAPRAMSPEWCEVDHGIAWLMRDDTGVRVRFVRKAAQAAPAVDATSALVGAPTSLAFLDCSEKAVFVSLSENERRLIVRMSPGAADFATQKPAPIEIDGPDDHTEDQRDLRVIPRGDEIAILFVGEQGGVAMRLLRAGQTAPTPWLPLVDASGASSPAGKPSKPFTYAFENDIVDLVAAPKAGGPIYLLSNEPMPPSGACAANTEPVRTVLHALEIDAEAKRGTVTTRPLVELPCGVDAIPARLAADATSAHVWWTEPVEDGSCAEIGLGVGAILEAGSDKPGARRSKILAESAIRLEDGRYLAVVRQGGCAPYAAPGNGALAWAPPPK
jgi:hypothetical protein